MKCLSLLVIFGLMLFASCSTTSKPETLHDMGYDEAEMEAAIARARSEVDTFIAKMNAGEGEDFGVKVPITDSNGTEHFWLGEITYANGVFKGVIGNDAGIVQNVTLGQSWEVKKEEISDWMYMKNGKMHGNYTMRPLLKTMPEEEAALFRAMLAEP